MGILKDPTIGFIQKVPPRAKFQCFHWTRFNTGRKFSFLEPIPAEIALLNFGKRTIVFKLWHVKRTRDHAQPATYTICVPGNMSFLSLFHGLYKTCRNTGRLIAVHALLFYKNLSLLSFIAVDNGPPGLCRIPFLFKYRIIGDIRQGQVMRLSARHLAPHAANTSGCINKNTEEFASPKSILGIDNRRYQNISTGNPSYPYSHRLQEFPPVHRTSPYRVNNTNYLTSIDRFL